MPYTTHRLMKMILKMKQISFYFSFPKLTCGIGILIISAAAPLR